MSRARVAEISLVGVAAVWGLTFVLVRDAIALLPVMAFLAYRFVPAALLVALVFRRRLRGLGRPGLRAGLLMGTFLTAGYVLQTAGLQFTTASNAGFITGLFVVLTPVLGALFLRQRAGTAAWAGAGVATVGLGLLSGAGGGADGLRAEGDGLVLLCAVAFAAHILATDRGVRDHDAGALLVVQLGLCGALCLVGAAALGDLAAPTEASVWIALAVTSVVASALGYFVQTAAQRYAPPARTALLLASEPAFAGLFGFLLAGDRLGALQWLGAALIMGAILAVELARRPLSPAADLP